MSALDQVPDWLLRPLPVNAIIDEALHRQIDTLAEKLPKSLVQIATALGQRRSFAEYDAAVNLACAHIWKKRDIFLGPNANTELKKSIMGFATGHMIPKAANRILRRFCKDNDRQIRAHARRTVEGGRIREVALPAKRDGTWDATGWLHGSPTTDLSRHQSGRRVQEKLGLPVLTTIKQLRELLGITSESQLGYFLLASDANNGPYTTFKIPKRSGGERTICAPKRQLRWMQRQILDKILGRVAAHDAAHGFVPGRSTVTNAQPHLGSEIIVKFDLVDFFPTIHFYRVIGLFASLGYHVGDARFQTENNARQIAPTLARLCCYTTDPEAWGVGTMPQGAPTSPAISNLVCRRLDARLTGLVTRNGGKYTRYADDLTFSFKSKGDLKLGRFRWWVDQICHQEGFFVNHAKFRVIQQSQRQVVTGIVVNESLHVPREARRRFRAVLHNCAKHGIESQARGNPRFAEYLRGFASYVHMVQPEEGMQLLEQVTALLGVEGPEDAE